MAQIDALVADLYGLSEEDFAYILTTFPLLDRDQPPLPGEPKSFITRDQALLELFRLRGKRPPEDIVAFFAQAGADIAPVTGPVRDLEERVRRAWELGAVAYVPSRRGGAMMGMSEEEAETVDFIGNKIWCILYTPAEILCEGVDLCSPMMRSRTILDCCEL